MRAERGIFNQQTLYVTVFQHFGNLFETNRFLLLCIYEYVLPALSIADVKMQETQRTDNSHSCHNPHDY